MKKKNKKKQKPPKQVKMTALLVDRQRHQKPRFDLAAWVVLQDRMSATSTTLCVNMEKGHISCEFKGHDKR
jgi:hypothetical protein